MPPEATSPPAQQPLSLETQVMQLAWNLKSFQDKVDERLNLGAERFTKLDTKFEGSRAKPWQIITFGFGVAIFIAGAIWQAARYPDRDEFNSAVRTQQTQINDLGKTVNQMQIDSTVMQKNVESIQQSQEREERSTDAIRDKLDKLLVSDAHPHR